MSRVRRASRHGGRVRRFFSALGPLLVLGSVGACARDPIDARADLLVRRNLFDGSSVFSIRNARAHQYGSLEVDGPEGGMMYRFDTDSSAVDWLIERWSLERIAPGSSAPVIPAEVPPGPSWWLPRGIDGLAAYRAELVDRYGSEQTVLLLQQPGSGTVFFLQFIRIQSSV